MEQFLNYYYDIYVDKCIKEKDNYYFYKDNNLFCIVKNYRSIEELNDIYLICLELLKNNIKTSNLIFNKFNSILSKYDDQEYVLLKINCNLNADIDINEIVNINNKVLLNNNKKELYRNDWAYLWESKIDYFEYQIKQLGKEKEIILNSFSYYIGLAENAISLTNYVNLSGEVGNIVLSHRRISYPNMDEHFYNPLNYIFDLSVRDVAEYLKSMFFYSDYKTTINEFKKYIKKVNLSNYEANMFYARLLYPTYYFDIYERVIENMLDESEILNIINKTSEFELFLKDIYFELSNKYKIEKIDWIVNKKEL